MPLLTSFMSNYYIQEEGIVSSQFGIELGTEFGELEMEGALALIRNIGIAPVWVIGTGGTVNTSFGLVHNDILYFGACDHKFYAIFAQNGQEKWRFRANNIIMSRPCIVNDSIYFGSHDGNLYCLDLEGKKKWTFNANSKINSAIKHAKGKIFFGTEEGNFYCVSISGKLLWSFSTNGSIVEGPGIGNNILVFGSWDRNVYALDFDGNIIWRFGANNEINVEPIILDGVCYFGSTDGNVYAIELKSGKELWRFNSDSSIRGLTYSDGLILLSSYNNKLVAINTKGLLQWNYAMDGYAVEPPVIKNGMIYVGSTDKNLHALDMNGRMVWKFPTNGFIVCTPVIWNDTILFGSYDCNVYSVNLEGKLIWKFQTSLSNISKIDTAEYERTKGKKNFTLKSQEIEIDEDLYKHKTAVGGGGEMGQYKVETGYTTNMSKYVGTGKYAK